MVSLRSQVIALVAVDVGFGSQVAVGRPRVNFIA